MIAWSHERDAPEGGRPGYSCFMLNPWYLLIPLGVIGLLVVFSVLGSWITGVPRAWRTLAERYPPVEPAPGATAGKAMIFLSETDDPKGVMKPRGCLFVGFAWFAGSRNAVNVSWAVDEEYFHLDLESGVAGPKRAMSVPWSVVSVGERIEAHSGEHRVVQVDRFTMFVPTSAIERELEVRAALEDASLPEADAFGPEGERRE